MGAFQIIFFILNVTLWPKPDKLFLFFGCVECFLFLHMIDFIIVKIEFILIFVALLSPQLHLSIRCTELQSDIDSVCLMIQKVLKFW